ncbi:hypothetical protein HPB52_012571 [Rhipicephalus sanguineus]|uniref:Uncharacterized protein n=1 Tax=Rhipicephalus sanguineus TaxID=34632 RepID=A0A9D4PX35_RHISA|nr:hypothetical protein HPB52_012571 [Rhipicephalus sanguineus]
MKEIVAGTEITPEEFEASEWLTQVNKSREARTSKGTTIPPASDTQDGRSTSHKTSNASNDDTAATDRSLTPRQPNFPKSSVRGEDLIQVNPKQNTFAYCTPSVERAERVLRLKELVIGTHTYEISVYCAPDESQGCGVIRGVDLRLDRQGIQEELEDPRNPPIVDFRLWGTPPPCC